MWGRKKVAASPEITQRDEADEQGLHDAQEALDRALSQWPSVTRTVADIRGIRMRNHLADQVSDAIGGHPR